jgi:tetratricopeptide (TPR) repeat protein
MTQPAFEFIEQAFAPAEGDVLQATAKDISPSEAASPTFQFSTFFHAVINQQLCPHPDNDGWYCVPVHDEENPILTDEYVVFIDHQLRGARVLLRDAEDDTQHTSFTPDEFSEFPLVNRLRFWEPSFYTEGIEQARSFATRTIATTDCTETAEPLDEDFDRLMAAIQGLDYTVGVGHDLPSVERATIENQRGTLREYIDRLREIEQQAKIQTAVDDIQRHIARGKGNLDAANYETARSAYRDGENRLDQLRHNHGDSVEANERVDAISQQLSEGIQTTQVEQQQEIVEDLQTVATEAENQAREPEENGDYLQARALHREARQTYERALDAATRLPERRDEIATALDRVSERIEATEREFYDGRISTALDQATRYERLGDELSERDSHDDAIREYDRALTHADTAVDFATEGDVLVEETTSCKETLQRKRATEGSERDRERVEQLVDDATTLEQEHAEETPDQTLSIDTLEELRELLVEARNLAESAEGVDTTRIESHLSDIEGRYRTQLNEIYEQANEPEIAAAEEQYEAGERLVEADKPVAAIQSFRKAREEYVALRESLTDRRLGRVDLRVKARLLQIETELRTIRQGCQTRVESRLDSAKKAIENANRCQETFDYRAAESELGDALQEYQEAYRIASELQSEQLQSIRRRFRKAESKVRSLRAVPAKLEIQSCIEDARRNTQAGDDAQRQGKQANAGELYSDALYFIEEAIDIVTEYELGTTVDIERYNLRILTRNKQTVETAQRHVDGVDATESPVLPKIENVTEHLRPPNALADEIEAMDSENREPSAPESASGSDRSAQTAALDIYDDIMSEFDDISDL